MKRFRDGRLGFAGWAALVMLGYVWAREAAHDLYRAYVLGLPSGSPFDPVLILFSNPLEILLACCLAAGLATRKTWAWIAAMAYALYYLALAMRGVWQHANGLGDAQWLPLAALNLGLIALIVALLAWPRRLVVAAQ